jgi:hypothetical protein
VPDRDLTVSWGELTGLPGGTLSQLGIQFVDFTVTATNNADGSAATLAGVDVAVLAPGATPAATTVWTASTYAAGTGTAVALLAGAAVAVVPAGALVISAPGAVLWARTTDTPEVDVHAVGQITLV